MKLEQLSGATVLRPDITVKQKRSANSAEHGPGPFRPVETIRVGRREIKVVSVESGAGEGVPRAESGVRPRCYEEQICRAEDGTLYLRRVSWWGRVSDWKRRRLRVRVRRIGVVGALLWHLQSVSFRKLNHDPKLARQFWAKATAKGAFSKRTLRTVNAKEAA